MSHIALLPTLTFRYEILFELIFAVVALLVAHFARRIYRISEQRQARIFSDAFYFIASSYALKSVLNFLIVSKLNEDICAAMKLQSVAMFNFIGATLHMILMSAGVIMLLCLSLGKPQPKMYAVLFLGTLMAMLTSASPPDTFYMLLSLYLAFIAWHYMGNYLRRRRLSTGLVAVAFLLLFIGNLHFIFISHHEAFFMAGHLFELGTYLLLLINFILVHRR